MPELTRDGVNVHVISIRARARKEDGQVRGTSIPRGVRQNSGQRLDLDSEPSGTTPGLLSFQFTLQVRTIHSCGYSMFCRLGENISISLVWTNFFFFFL